MTYTEQLQHPKWQMRRLDVLKRDKATCQLCGDKETTLHVHHKEYKKGVAAWDYPLDNFTTLCKYCHLMTEFFKPAPYKLCKAVKMHYSNSRFYSCFLEDREDDNIQKVAFLIFRTEDGMPELDFMMSKSDSIMVAQHFKKIKPNKCH